MRKLEVFIFPAIMLALLTACDMSVREIIEPDFDPYLLKPGKSFPARMISINMDSVASPTRLPAQAETITLGEPQIYPEYSNYHPAGKPRYIQAPLRKMDMSQFSKPDYYPSQGKKVAATWPEWTPARPSYSRGTPFHVAYLNVEQGLNSNRIHDLIEDSQGRIWIGTGNGVSVYDGAGLMHFTSAQGLLGGNVRCVLEDRKGRIWMGTMGGLSVWDGTDFTHFTKEDGFQDANVWNNTLMEDSRGNIWVGTWDGGLSVWDGEGFHHYTTAQGLSSNRPRGILEDNQGRIWIGYEGSRELNVLNPTQNGQIWTYTVGGVLSMVQDQKGKIWIATGNGLKVWDPAEEGQFTHYTTAEGLSSNNISRLMIDRNENLWIGTPRGEVNMWDGRGFYHFTEKEGLIANNRVSIMEDQDGRIWVSGFLNGLSIFNPPQNNPFIRPNTAEDFNTDYPNNRLVESRDGRVWLGTVNKGLFIWNPGKERKFSQYRTNEGLSRNYITGLRVDRNNNVWFGAGGLNKWDLTNDRQLTKFSPLGGRGPFEVVEDLEGNIWSGYNAKGISVWDESHFLHYMPKQGLAHHGMVDLVADQQGRIWMGGVGL